MGGGDTHDDGLEKLNYLSLVSKVCTELENHNGFGDKVLAEFITELGRQCENVDQFDKLLRENGADMPDYFVRTLLTIIHAILPPKPKVDKGVKDDGGSFQALKIKDGRERVKELEKEIEEEARSRRRVENDDVETLENRNRGNDRRERGRDRHGGRDRGRGDRRGHRDDDRRGGRDGYDDDRRRRGDRDGYDDGDDRRRHGVGMVMMVISVGMVIGIEMRGGGEGWMRKSGMTRGVIIRESRNCIKSIRAGFRG